MSSSKPVAFWHLAQLRARTSNCKWFSINDLNQWHIDCSPGCHAVVVIISTQGRTAMPEFVFVSQAARELREQLGVQVRPQDLTNLLYRGELRSDRCPILGGRRLIPRAYLPEIANHLRRRGQAHNVGEAAP
jgi:hypothetical protein